MVVAKRGDLITCNPGEVHDGMPIGDSREWKMLYLPPSLVAAFTGDIREGRYAEFEFHNPVIEGRAHAAAFAAAYDALTGRLGEIVRAQERLLLLLTGLLRPKPPPSRGVPPALARAKTLIDDDPAAPITLAELAREAGVSRFQVVRGFAKLTGLTPHAYIVQRRLDTARAMITAGTTLATVAVDCGFADQSHFNRAFVARYGLTPGAFAAAVR